ncbi:MAG: AsmA family protein, partial [Pseudomonadales bacterium]
MSRMKSLVVFFVGFVLAIFALLFALQLSTSNSAKASLETYLSEQTGLTTRIEGDVNWRYLWPTAVTLNSVSARNNSGSEHWVVDTLRIELSTLSIVQAPHKPEQWRVSGFKLAQLRGERQLEGQPNTESDQVVVEEFWIRELQPEQAAPFAATLTYRQALSEPVDLSLNGKLRFIASERRLHFEPAMISGAVASGECNADITLRAIVESAVPLSPEQIKNHILNVDLWRRSDWDLKCELTHVSLLGTSFEQVSLHSNNFLGNSQTTLKLPVFFSGSAQLNFAI